MSSKANLRSSKRERPKSGEKMKGKKRDGTPEKSATPNMSQDALDENQAAIRNVIMNEEIERLEIKEDDLAKLPRPPPGERKKTPPLRSVMVKKENIVTSPSAVVSVSESKKLKTVVVAKPAPPDAPLKPLENSGFAGPRYDDDGKVIVHSILGSYEQFRNEALARGDLLDLPISGTGVVVSDVPTVKYEKRPPSTLDRHVTISSTQDQSSALINWQNRMIQRKRQQGHISNLLQKDTDSLVMNQQEHYRQTQEQRYLIDRTIPAVDYGKGYRVGSEFWKQRERFGDDLTGIHMTLSQSEAGYPPPVEHIGIPDVIKEEKGVTDCWCPNTGAAIKYPWQKSSYLGARKHQLQKLMNELAPHKPDFSRLAVVGMNQPQTAQERDIDVKMMSQQFEVAVEESSKMEEEEALRDPLAAHPDVYPAPFFGPSLRFADQPARWTGDSYSYKNQIGIEARVTFETYAGERVTSNLEVFNDGTTSVYYDWKKLPKSNPFDVSHAKVQRFYFNTSSGVILPGETIRFPFVFKSPNAGVFTEQWHFETRPIVCGGAALVVTLRGIALQEDKYQEERLELERELSYRQAEQIVGQIMGTLISGIQTPVRCQSPIDAYITDEQLFTRNNPKFSYHPDIVKDLASLYSELQSLQDDQQVSSTPDTWDLSLDTIHEMVLELDEDDENKESAFQRLNKAVNDLACQPFTPVQGNMYRACYQLLQEAVDDLVCQAGQIRQVLGLPDKDTDDLLDIDGMQDGKRSKAAEPKKDTKEVAPKKGAAAKDTKAAKGKETPKGDSKSKAQGGGGAGGGAAAALSVTKSNQKPGSRAGVVPQSSKELMDHAITPPSTRQSPIPSVLGAIDPVLERKYKEKLYQQAYDIILCSADRISSALHRIHEDENTPP